MGLMNLCGYGDEHGMEIQLRMLNYGNDFSQIRNP